MRLDVGMTGAEQLLGALDGEGFHLIRVFLAAVIALAGISFAVFVVEHVAHRFHHRGGDVVLRGDQLHAVALALHLAHEGIEDRFVLGFEMIEGGHEDERVARSG